MGIGAVCITGLDVLCRIILFICVNNAHVQL